jgi:hypothetical protein
LIAFALPALCSANLAFADHEHMSNEFEVFLAAEGYHGSGHVHAADDDSWVSADVVFGVTQHQFRVFGELYITPSERDLERLQFGFEFVPETVLWIGRFHQPASAWNTEHHHGHYLRPPSLVRSLSAGKTSKDSYRSTSRARCSNPAGRSAKTAQFKCRAVPEPGPV